MYQVHNGDYAALINKLDRIALQKIRDEALISLKEHQKHSSSAPESYASLEHGNSSDSEITAKLLHEDEQRFARIRSHEQDENQKLHQATEHELSGSKEKNSNAKSSFLGIFFVFAVFCVISSLPSQSDLSFDFDPMFLVFVIAAAFIVTVGILGNLAKNKKRGS